MNKKLKILTVVAAVLFIVGVGFLLFAPISNQIGKINAEKAVAQFDETKSKTKQSVVIKGKKITSAKELEPYIKSGDYTVDDSSSVVFKKDIARLKKDSESYNKRLWKTQGTKAMIGYEKPALDLTKYGIYNGVYCYLSAPSIGLDLPVYLGSSDQKMSWGAAHMYGTSLPIGGSGTNASLAGHTGYIGRIFFDNIRSLKKGDEVAVTTYWNKLKYKVVDTTVIKPNEFSSLALGDDEQQQLNLLTCIKNDKGGFDRYVVICQR